MHTQTNGKTSRYPTSRKLEGQQMLIPSDIDTLPEAQFVIERLGIIPGSLTLLCGTGCSGKTMFAQYLACCVSSGMPLFGQFPVETKGKVVHIDAEQSWNQTLKRYCRICHSLNLSSAFIVRHALKARFESSITDIQQTEEELTLAFEDATMVVIDSLKGTSSADENSGDVEPILKMFKRVAEKTGAAIVLIHHKGKVDSGAKQSGRGHSSIYDSVDSQIDLNATEGSITLKCAKARDTEYFAGLSFVMKDTGDWSERQRKTKGLSFELVNSDIPNSKNDKRATLLIALRGGPTKLTDLFKSVRGNRESFDAVLSSAVKAGDIVESSGTRGARIFTLTDQGKSASDQLPQ